MSRRFSHIESVWPKTAPDSTPVSSVGKDVGQFEGMLGDFTGARHAVVVVNGTAALHLALMLADVRSRRGARCPPFSFVATAESPWCTVALRCILSSSSIDTMGGWIRWHFERPAAVAEPTGGRLPESAFGQAHCRDRADAHAWPIPPRS